MAVQISKKRKFVSDGIFKAELNEFLTRELAEDGYSGVEVRVTPTRTEIIILATRTQNVLGEKGRRIRELTAVVQKRFGFPEGSVEVCLASRLRSCFPGTPAARLAPRSLCLTTSASWNPRRRSSPPPQSLSRKEPSLKFQSCHKELLYPLHKRVFAIG
uniref:Ribosomal protein S3 n=1 Tax=Astyanax mexicanus TaxID=7994 RepID=A0A3B1J8E3_ASTMX